MTLPSSHNVSGDLARVGDYPISVDGGTADVWEGTHDGRKVCIKCPRVSEADLQAVTQVRLCCPHPSFAPLKNTVGAVVVPQRGRYMEKAEAPKHRSFHWCYNKTFTVRLGVYAERYFDQVRQEQSERGSDWPGENFLRSDRSIDDAVFPSYWMWPRVSTTFTQTIRSMET